MCRGYIIKWNIETGQNTFFVQLASQITGLSLLCSNNQYLSASTGIRQGEYKDFGLLWVFNVTTDGFIYNDESTYAETIYFVFGDTFLDDSLSLDLPAD